MQEIDSRAESARDRPHANSESPGTNDFTRTTTIDSASPSEDPPINSPTKEVTNDENIDSELQSTFDSSASAPVTTIESMSTPPSKNQPSMTPVKGAHSESHNRVQSESPTPDSPDKSNSDTATIESPQLSVEETRVLTPAINRAPHTSPG